MHEARRARQMKRISGGNVGGFVTTMATSPFRMRRAAAKERRAVIVTKLTILGSRRKGLSRGTRTRSMATPACVSRDRADVPRAAYVGWLQITDVANRCARPSA